MSDKIGYIGFIVREICLLALIGFLCWLFRNGWACLLILCSGRFKWVKDDDEKDGGEK